MSTRTAAELRPVPVLVLAALACGQAGEVPEPAIGAACPPCRIEFLQYAQLGSIEDPWSVKHVFFSRIERRSNGEFLAHDFGRTLGRYDRTGAYLGTVGRPGSGPGEFRLIRRIAVDDADSIYVVDVTRRMEVFTPDLKPARSLHFAHSTSWLLPYQNGFVVHGHERDSIKGQHRLHAVSRAGAYVRAIDEPMVHHGFDMGDGVTTRVAALVGRDSLAILNLDTPRVDIYDAQLKRLNSFALSPSWYPLPEIPRQRCPGNSEERTYEKALRPWRATLDMHVDRERRLWVLAMVEAPDWEKRKPPFAAAPCHGRPADFNHYFVGQIDVFSISGQFLATEKLPFLATTFLRDGVLVRAIDSPEGLVQFVIYRPGLVKQ
ncbi:MAG: 6-bladed beta-propeller [Longimicrobiales bacterium]